MRRFNSFFLIGLPKNHFNWFICFCNWMNKVLCLICSIFIWCYKRNDRFGRTVTGNSYGGKHWEQMDPLTVGRWMRDIWSPSNGKKTVERGRQIWAHKGLRALGMGLSSHSLGLFSYVCLLWVMLSASPPPPFFFLCFSPPLILSFSRKEIIYGFFPKTGSPDNKAPAQRPHHSWWLEVWIQMWE